MSKENTPNRQLFALDSGDKSPNPEVLPHLRTEITLEDIHRWNELGAHTLPIATEGTKKSRETTNEAKNRGARVTYLKDNLGLDATTIADPNNEGKPLSERLVSDVIVDLVGLSQIVKDLEEQGIDPQPFIDTQNADLQLRLAKGKLRQLQISTPTGDISYRKYGIDGFQYSPSRASDPVSPEGLSTIVEVFENALQSREAV